MRATAGLTQRPPVGCTARPAEQARMCSHPTAHNLHRGLFPMSQPPIPPHNAIDMPSSLQYRQECSRQNPCTCRCTLQLSTAPLQDVPCQCRLRQPVLEVMSPTAPISAIHEQPANLHLCTTKNRTGIQSYDPFPPVRTREQLLMVFVPQNSKLDRGKQNREGFSGL